MLIKLSDFIYDIARAGIIIITIYLVAEVVHPGVIIGVINIQLFFFIVLIFSIYASLCGNQRHESPIFILLVAFLAGAILIVVIPLALPWKLLAGALVSSSLAAAVSLRR